MKAQDSSPPEREESKARRDVAAALVLTSSGLALWLGLLSAVSLNYEAVVAPFLLLHALALTVLAGQLKRRLGIWERQLLLLAVASVAGAIVLNLLPLHITGWQINGILHRSLLSAAWLLVLGVASLSRGVYCLRGRTPHAEDLSRYPLLVAPVFLVLAVYALLLVAIGREGLPNLKPEALLTPYRVLPLTEEIWVDGWPTWVDRTLSEVGMRNHIAGTLLLMVLTALLATPVGVSVGVFVSEYGPPWLARTIRGCTTLLRATSPFVLAMMAITLVRASQSTWLSDLVAGFYVTTTGIKHPASGSFLLAAAMIAVLVVPVIARATEQGCRSVPVDLREASWSLGASDSYTLRRIVLPWSLPSVVTGVLLGCAEAAGTLAIIMFIAGSGDFGVGPLRQVTSLTYVIYGAQYGVSKAFRNDMRPYQSTAAIVLLVITIALTVGAQILKSRFAKRYQGA